MKILTKRLLLASVLWSVFAIATGSTAQNRERNTRPNREEVEGMMEAYILSKLQDALDLTDEQFGSMVVAQKKLSDTRRGYRRDRMQVLRQMQQTLQREQAGESELQPLLSELDTLRDDFAANERSRYAAIDAILDIRPASTLPHPRGRAPEATQGNDAPSPRTWERSPSPGVPVRTKIYLSSSAAIACACSKSSGVLMFFKQILWDLWELIRSRTSSSTYVVARLATNCWALNSPRSRHA